MGESSKRGEIPAVTLFQSSSLYERVLPKAGPEHTVSTEKREKEKKRQSNKQARQHSTVTTQNQTALHSHYANQTKFRPTKTLLKKKTDTEKRD